MDAHVERQLLKSGWRPDRHVELKAEISVLEDEGYESWPELLAFLEEYADLLIKSDDGTRTLWIGAARAVREVDRGWASAYSEVIQSVLAPVGGYSHMTIYLGQNGVFYGGFDSEYGPLASNIEELVNAVLNQCPPARLEWELE
jgi:SUKH-3 immunity protein